MSRKKKIIIHIILFLTQIACVALYLCFVMKDYHIIIEYIPLAVGAVATVGHFCVRYYQDGEPEEWYGNINVTEEHDE